MKKIILLAMLVTNSAYAFEATGKITRIEPTFSDHLNIMLDVNAGSCLAGSWLFFYGAGTTDQEKKDSVKMVYSGLLASMYSSKSVVFYGVDQGCVVNQVHLLPN